MYFLFSSAGTTSFVFLLLCFFLLFQNIRDQRTGIFFKNLQHFFMCQILIVLCIYRFIGENIARFGSSIISGRGWAKAPPSLVGDKKAGPLRVEGAPSLFVGWFAIS